MLSPFSFVSRETVNFEAFRGKTTKNWSNNHSCDMFHVKHYGIFASIHTYTISGCVSRETLLFPAQRQQPDFWLTAEAKIDALASDALRDQYRKSTVHIPTGQESLFPAVQGEQGAAEQADLSAVGVTAKR